MRTLSLVITALCLVLLSLGGLTQQAAAEPNYAVFQKSCMKGCTPDGKEAVFCKKYCACALGEVKKQGDEKAQLAALTSKKAIEQIKHVCSGRTGVQHAVDECLKACGTNADCHEACRCIGGKLRSMGTEAEVGRIMIAIGSGDKETEAKADKLTDTCLPKQ